MAATGQKLAEMWRNLSDEDKEPWVQKQKEENAAYQEKLQEFQATENYIRYKKLSNVILGVNSKSKGKSKSSQPAVPMPEKPANMPVDPKTGFNVYAEEQRISGGPAGLREAHKKWIDLQAEGQQKYNDQATELRNEYETAMTAFKETAEGKKYLREKDSCDKRSRLAKAKKRYLGGDDGPKEPKRPCSSYFLFLGEKSSAVAGADRSEKAKELSSQWNGMSPEDKKVYEDKAKELKEKYDAEMKEFKESKGYKSFARQQDVISGKTAKMAAAMKAKRAMMEKQKERAQQQKEKAAKTSSSAARPAAAAGAAPKDDDEMGSDSKSSKSSKKSSSSSSSSSSGSD